MTQRDFFTAVINGTITDEMKEYAEGAIRKLDERNIKRSATPTKAQVANEATMTKICEFLATREGTTLGSEIAQEFNISTQKVSGLMKLLAERNRVTVTEVKVPKSGKRKAYALATTEE